MGRGVQLGSSAVPFKRSFQRNAHPLLPARCRVNPMARSFTPAGTSLSLAAGVPGLRADFTGGAGDLPRLCREGKLELTKALRSPDRSRGNSRRPSTRQRPEGSLREVRERLSPGTPAVFT